MLDGADSGLGESVAAEEASGLGSRALSPTSSSSEEYSSQELSPEALAEGQSESSCVVPRAIG